MANTPIKPVSTVFRDEATIRRFARVGNRRGIKKTARVIRELAMERLLQVESDGDPAAIRSSTK